ncbi:MAG TPA: DUF2007 domain-containing protein [Rhodothermales bacterium]|nr:DUF2007 domain-containing protein [Rhodothermales bacterium]
MPNAKDSGRLVTVARFDYPYQAHLAAAQLESAGIPALVADESLTGLRMFFSQTSGGVKVKVPEDRASEAKEVLARADDATGTEAPGSEEDEQV